eukprot:gene3998-6202_t
MKLLRKCENRQVPNMVVKLTSQGDRISAGDTTGSVHLLNSPSFADDLLPRWTTALVTLDRRTVAVGDKLGNINVGRLLVGVNNKVRIYDLGKMKLLRKCENRQVPNMVVKLTSQGDRIFAGDITDSVHLLNSPSFADDLLPRWTTALVTLDRRTVAVGDKLGNINVVRLDEHASEDLDNDPNCDTGSSKWLYDRGFLQGAPQRLQLVASYHVGSTVTSME